MSRMRIGVIGVGAHASANLYPNLRAAGMDLVAVCARSRERAEAAAVRWGAQKAFSDTTRMLDASELDGVVICVQAGDYAPLIAQCIEARIPVFCEKPAAGSADEADDLAARSAATGVPVVVGYMKRFAPAYRRAHAIVSSADFGPPTLANFTFTLGPWKAGGLRHYLTDNPVHHLDLARRFLGELSDMHAHVAQVSGDGFAVAATARSVGGAVCTFNFGTTSSWHQRNEYAEIYGTGRSVWIENVDTLVSRGPAQPEHVWRPNYTVGVRENSSPTVMGFLPALEHFRSVVIDGVPNESDIASAAATLRLSQTLCELAPV